MKNSDTVYGLRLYFFTSGVVENSDIYSHFLRSLFKLHLPISLKRIGFNDVPGLQIVKNNEVTYSGLTFCYRYTCMCSMLGHSTLKGHVLHRKPGICVTF